MHKCHLTMISKCVMTLEIYWWIEFSRHHVVLLQGWWRLNNSYMSNSCGTYFLFFNKSKMLYMAKILYINAIVESMFNHLKLIDIGCQSTCTKGWRIQNTMLKTYKTLSQVGHVLVFKCFFCIGLAFKSFHHVTNDNVQNFFANFR